MNIKRLGWFAISTFIIALMLYLSDITKFIEHLQQADKAVLASAIFVGLGVIPVLANSWHHLINRVGAEISFYRALKLFTAGNFLNAVTPLGQFGGEPFMAYVIKDNTDVKYEDALSAVISADIINAVPILTFVIGGSFFLLFSGSMNGVVLEAIYISAVITVLGGAIAYLLWFKSGFIEKRLVAILRKLTGFVGRGDEYVDRLEERMDGLQNAFKRVGEEPLDLIKISIVAHLFFVFQVISLYLVMASVGVETDLAPLYIILPMASLANFSPTPGGSGTHEAAMAGILSAFLGLSGSIAVTIAILYRFTTFWPGLFIGYVSFTSLSAVSEGELERKVSSENLRA